MPSRGNVSGNCNLLKYQPRLNVMIKWRTLWPMKESATGTKRAKGTKGKGFRVLTTVRWETRTAKLQDVYSQLSTSRIGIWPTLGQMQITHGLLQCELSCSQPFPKCLQADSIPSSLSTKCKKPVRTRTPFSLFDCTLVLSSAPRAAGIVLYATPTNYYYN